MKIGLFGGTFDPIHIAHLKLAENIFEEFSLDKIIFIPSGTSYFKTQVTDKWIRYKMVELGINNYPNFEVSDIETKKDGNSYASETIKTLKKEYPTDQLYWIMGSDTFLELPTWKDYTFLLNHLFFIVYMRPGDLYNIVKKTSVTYEKKYKTMIHIMNDMPFLISSSEIRKNIHDYNFSSSYLPKSISAYIKENKLY